MPRDAISQRHHIEIASVAYRTKRRPCLANAEGPEKRTIGRTPHRPHLHMTPSSRPLHLWQPIPHCRASDIIFTSTTIHLTFHLPSRLREKCALSHQGHRRRGVATLIQFELETYGRRRRRLRSAHLLDESTISHRHRRR